MEATWDGCGLTGVIASVVLSGCDLGGGELTGVIDNDEM